MPDFVERRGHLVCECGHFDKQHNDVDDGSRFGRLGEGNCKLCLCDCFVPIRILDDREE
jgi:hypothetical protein